MKLRNIKRKCFSVLLIIVLVIQDPSISKAGYLEHEVYLENEQTFLNSLSEEIIKENEPELESLNEFHIDYYLNGGTFAEEVPSVYRYDELPSALETPEREGYNFAGWYADSHFSDKVSELNEDTIKGYALYAKWTRCIDDDYSIQMYAYQNTTASKRSEKKLKNCSYGFMNEVAIPGMPSTRENDMKENRITDTSQCPQGICLTDDYLLVSSYSSKASGNLGCIHVFDRKTGIYLVTLGMRKKSHLGGLTFDGENIWVCHSNNSTLECIPYVFVQRLAADKPQCVIDCSTLFESFQVSNTPSCISYYDGKIWVATHTKMLNSRMAAYQITRNGLRLVETYRIPDKVQGVTFDDKGKVYLSTSYGRQNSSYIKVYDSIQELDKKPNQPKIKVEMPPCSEEIDIEGDAIYILFESAGEKYFEGTDGKGRSISPIEQILTLSKRSIFQ